MIEAKSVDVSSLPFVQLEEEFLLPAVPGIYFAIAVDGTVQYIGRSQNLRARWQQHHRKIDLKQMPGVRVAWLQVDMPELLPLIEEALINHFEPPLNGSPVTKEKRLKQKLVNVSLLITGGEFMAFMRERAGLSQKQLGQLIGKTDQTISDWERGRSVPTLTPCKMRLLCDALNVTLDQLADAFPPDSETA